MQQNSVSDRQNETKQMDVERTKSGRRSREFIHHTQRSNMDFSIFLVLNSRCCCIRRISRDDCTLFTKDKCWYCTCLYGESFCYCNSTEFSFENVGTNKSQLSDFEQCCEDCRHTILITSSHLVRLFLGRSISMVKECSRHHPWRLFLGVFNH